MTIYLPMAARKHEPIPQKDDLRSPRTRVRSSVSGAHGARYCPQRHGRHRPFLGARSDDGFRNRAEAESVLEDAWQDFKNLTLADAYPVNADNETKQFIRYWFDGYARRQLA